jgi:hypothetical protein
MLDLVAAAAAARKVLENAPVLDTVDGGDGVTPIVSLTELAQAVLTAANPEALVIPPYDAALAQSARYRLAQDTENGPLGAKASITAHPGAVAVGIYSGEGKTLSAGLVGPDAVWLFGLACCSAAMDSERQRREAAVAVPQEVKG